MKKKPKLKKKVAGYNEGGNIRYLAPLTGAETDLPTVKAKPKTKKWGEGSFLGGLSDAAVHGTEFALAPLTMPLQAATGKTLSQHLNYEDKTKMGESMTKYMDIQGKGAKIAAPLVAGAFVPGSSEFVSQMQNLGEAEMAKAKKKREDAALMESIKYSPDQYTDEEELAEGGEIKGKGTPKSDSIKAKIKPGSFIVPAENAGLAEVLRKTYLSDRGGKANLNQKGGTDVKVSNKEHMFTPEEKALLLKKGVNVPALAPNAEKINELAEAGDVVSRAEAAKNKTKKQDEETEKLAAAWDRRKEAEKAKSEMDKYEKEIERLTTHLENVKPGQGLSKKAIQSELDKNLNLYGNWKMQFDKNAPDDMKAKTPTLKPEEIKAKSYGSMAEALGGGKYQAAPDAKSLIEAPVGKPTDKPTGTGTGADKGGAKSGYDPTTDPSNPAYGFKGGAKANQGKPDYSVEPDAIIPKRGLTGPMVPSVAPEKLDPAKDLNKAPEATKQAIQEKKDFNTDLRVADMVGLAQLGIGLHSAKKDGPRPEWLLDQDFNASVERSKADAAFGFDPYTKQGMTSDINTARLGVQGLAAGYAGGDPTRAIAQSRAAANSYARNLVDLSAADSRLKLDKQRYSDSMINQRAQMRRQQFDDKLRAFEMNQQASSELINAGLSNILGASEARRNEKMLADAYGKNKADNAAMFDEILKAVQKG